MTTTIKLPRDIATASPAAQQRYRDNIAQGMTPNLAEMLALRKAPRVMTDSVFFEGRGTLDKQFGEKDELRQLDELIAAAKSHGVPPYVIFHDATLAEIARRAPTGLGELRGIAGVGATKLERYGAALLEALEGA